MPLEPGREEGQGWRGRKPRDEEEPVSYHLELEPAAVCSLDMRDHLIQGKPVDPLLDEVLAAGPLVLVPLHPFGFLTAAGQYHLIVMNHLCCAEE